MLSCFTEIPVCNANSVDPDQTPRSAASDLGLHCLPASLLGKLSINGLICFPVLSLVGLKGNVS